jgi:hypothetical protein
MGACRPILLCHAVVTIAVLRIEIFTAYIDVNSATTSSNRQRGQKSYSVCNLECPPYQ